MCENEDGGNLKEKGWRCNDNPDSINTSHQLPTYHRAVFVAEVLCVTMSSWYEDEDRLLGVVSTWITSMANFSVQYNFASISLAFIIMSQSVCTSTDDNCAQGIQADWVEGASEAGIFIGAVCGEIGFGYLGDYFGRSEAMIMAMLIAFLGTFISAFFSFGGPTAVYSTIITFRFMTGIGLGGMFPLSATKASEDAARQAGRVNSQASSWSFFWQLPALLMPYLLGIAVSNSDLSSESRWRFILGFGVIPCFLTLCFLFYERRLLSQRAQKQKVDDKSIEVHSRNSSQHSNAEEQKSDLFTHQNTILNSSPRPNNNSLTPTTAPIIHSELSLGQIYHLLTTQPLLRQKLLAAGGSWFLYDVVVYGLGLLSTYTISAIDTDDGNISSDASVRELCEQQLIALASVCPATILSIWLVPHMGLKYLQMLGFAFMGVCSLIVAATFTTLSHNQPRTLFGLYCVVYASLNFGAGITTFSLPAALFPKEIRTTFNGLAAAMGKIGAVLSTFTFYLIAEQAGYPTLLAICSAVSFFGVVFTYVLIDSTHLLTDSSAGQGTTINNGKHRQSSLASSSYYGHNSRMNSMDQSFSSSSAPNSVRHESQDVALSTLQLNTHNNATGSKPIAIAGAGGAGGGSGLDSVSTSATTVTTTLSYREHQAMSSSFTNAHTSGPIGVVTSKATIRGRLSNGGGASTSRHSLTGSNTTPIQTHVQQSQLSQAPLSSTPSPYRLSEVSFHTGGLEEEEEEEDNREVIAGGRGSVNVNSGEEVGSILHFPH